MTSPRVVAFGECMLELGRTVLGGKSWQLGVAGDSYNVAAYLRRLGADVAYMTALGTDQFSDDMRAVWAAETVDTALVVSHPKRIPGLYAITLDSAGERSFTYWRGQSAARAFFECSGASTALRAAGSADLLYISGITLSLFTEAERERVAMLAAGVQRRGGKVAFDTNYRVRGWDDTVTARRAIEGFARHADILLPTFSDDQALFADASPAACARRWLALAATGGGPGEVVVKLGEAGALVADGAGETPVAAEKVAAVRDTTGAGDAFNAAYLAARLAGLDPVAAARCGARLAARVVQHSGAIIDRMAMPIHILPAGCAPWVK